MANKQTEETHDEEEREAEKNWDVTTDNDVDHSDVKRDTRHVLRTRNTLLMGCR